MRTGTSQRGGWLVVEAAWHDRGPARLASAGGLPSQQVTATFTAGGESGVADVRAYSGAAVSEPATVTIGAAAVSGIRLSAQPGALPPGRR